MQQPDSAAKSQLAFVFIASLPVGGGGGSGVQP